MMTPEILAKAPPNLRRELERWYDLKPHPVQLALNKAVDSGVRFPVVPAGRRSGKTERAKRFVVKKALQTPGRMFFCAAPTHSQAKKIFWKDVKELTLSSTHLKKPSESELILFLPNGAEIHVIGLDNADRFEGIPWAGGVIDETASLKSDSIEANIMPALNTVDPRMPDYRAWCWFIGVPDGLNHYYDMHEYAKTANDPHWQVFHWVSEDILPPDVIESAKRSMSARQYAQEYLASFQTAGGKIYDDYSEANYCDEQAYPHEELHWSHDQNYTPLSSSIAVIRNDKIYLVDEIVLESAVSEQSALEFVERYKNHANKHVCIYGDPAGKAGEKHGHRSDYTAIEGVLRQHGWRFTRRVATAHPPIKDRQNAVRALIKNANGETRLFVNPNKAKMCHKGLATVQLQPGSSFQEDQRNPAQHITTAIGYMVHFLYPQGVVKTKSMQIHGLIS